MWRESPEGVLGKMLPVERVKPLPNQDLVTGGDFPVFTDDCVILAHNIGEDGRPVLDPDASLGQKPIVYRVLLQHVGLPYDRSFFRAYGRSLGNLWGELLFPEAACEFYTWFPFQEVPFPQPDEQPL
jgi:hypothetical protein